MKFFIQVFNHLWILFSIKHLYLSLPSSKYYLWFTSNKMNKLLLYIVRFEKIFIAQGNYHLTAQGSLPYLKFLHHQK